VDIIYLIYLRRRLYTMYNLNYVPTILGVQSFKRKYIWENANEKRLDITVLDKRILQILKSQICKSCEESRDITDSVVCILSTSTSIFYFMVRPYL
jgi:hypothetical protein